MIAIVTSTIKTSKKQKSIYSYTERLEQTKQTLNTLIASGFTSIFLVDNSPSINQDFLKEVFQDYSTVQINHIQQYQFDNKGINEIMMLLYMIQFLPVDQNIFKISGRYFPTKTFKKPEFLDFAFKGYNYKNRKGSVSTRGYWVKNTEIFEEFLINCLQEVFIYPKRIVGFKSFFRKIQRIISNKKQESLNISIEFAAAKILKKSSYKVNFLQQLGIQGYLAGSENAEKITE